MEEVVRAASTSEGRKENSGINMRAKSGLLGLLLLLTGPIALHVAAPVQRSRLSMNAERLLAEADRLIVQYRIESSRTALTKYQEALRLLEALDDRIGVIR